MNDRDRRFDQSQSSIARHSRRGGRSRVQPSGVLARSDGGRKRRQRLGPLPLVVDCPGSVERFLHRFMTRQPWQVRRKRDQRVHTRSAVPDCPGLPRAPCRPRSVGRTSSTSDPRHSACFLAPRDTGQAACASSRARGAIAAGRCGRSAPSAWPREDFSRTAAAQASADAIVSGGRTGPSNVTASAREGPLRMPCAEFSASESALSVVSRRRWPRCSSGRPGTSTGGPRSS